MSTALCLHGTVCEPVSQHGYGCVDVDGGGAWYIITVCMFFTINMHQTPISNSPGAKQPGAKQPNSPGTKVDHGGGQRCQLVVVEVQVRGPLALLLILI